MTLLESALQYVRQGYSIFPVYEIKDGVCSCESDECKSPGKHPRVDKWQDEASSDVEKVTRWWTQWPQANIGLRTGELVVIDLDVKDDRDGLESLKGLGFRIEDCTVVNFTGGGGAHLFFKNHPSDPMGNRASILPGVDVRGRGGYVLLPPSNHLSGESYRVGWDRGVQQIPEILRGYIKQSKAQVGPSSFSTIQAGKGSRDALLMSFGGKMRRLGLNEAEIRASLLEVNKTRCVPPKDERDIERLARNCAKYEPSAPVTLEQASLNALIRRSTLMANVTNPEETKLYDPTTGLAHPIHVDVIRKELGRNDFRVFEANQMIHAAFGYNPRGERALTKTSHGYALFNQYQPPAWKARSFFFGEPVERVEKIPSLYEDFFRHLTGGHEESYEYLIDWLATSLQSRNMTLLTAIGTQGVGKGVLGNIMEGLHGPENYDNVRDQVFKSQFNSQLASKTLVYVDEVDLCTKEAHDRIKHVVNDSIEIERKGKDAYRQKNFASFYLSSNSFDAIKVEPGDRRFSIIQLTDKPLKDTNLINKINELQSGPNLEKLAAYLFHKKVTRDMLTPFRSARFEQVKEAGLTEWELYLIETWTQSNRGKAVLLSNVQEEIRQACRMYYPPGRRKFEELTLKYPTLLQVRKEWKANQRYVVVSNPDGTFPDVVPTTGPVRGPVVTLKTIK